MTRIITDSLGIIKIDKNGNKIVKIRPINKRAFSILTNGNLPLCHQKLSNNDKLYSNQDIEFWKEILKHIKNYGTEYQKSCFNWGE